MDKYPNKKVRNVRSPKNEQELINAYKEMNPKSKKPDGLDISSVVTVNGVRGIVLLPESINRSHDKNVHIGKDFISKRDLEKHIKNSK